MTPGVNTPPPPTISPERAARVVLAAVGSSTLLSQTSLTNYVLIGTFQLVPAVYDRLIGPIFDVASRGKSSCAR